jgi:SAM-dependent methyltransferase
MTDPAPHDAAFAKYAESGAYHWREIGRHWIRHNAFTAERYRRTLQAVAPLQGKRVLDYGCGDGALLGWIAHEVGANGAALGFDPNAEGLRLARAMLEKRRLGASLHDRLEEISDGTLDCVVCAEVIEHAYNPLGLLQQIHRVLRTGGMAVLTTPIRLTERPEDPNHVREWYFQEFAEFLKTGPLRVVRHEPFLPAAAAEIYFWRPPVFLRLPVFRLLCNVLSIHFSVNALSWLRVRPRLYMAQLAVLEKTA